MAVTAKSNFSSLVLAEHFNGKLNANLAQTITAASQMDSDVDVLVHGEDPAAQIEAVQNYPGIRSIFVAKDSKLENPYGDSIARIAKNMVEEHGYTSVVSAASGFGKDVIPRLGGLLDVQPITDVIEIVDKGAKFKRPVYAGNAIATVSTSDSIKLLTIRPTNFEKSEPGTASNGYPTVDVSADVEVAGTWI
jgi:electron transfer flavoprotein alpha subunit